MAGSLELLAGYKQPIQAVIEKSLYEFTSQLPELSADASWALDSLTAYCTRPSKKIRGSLAAALYDHLNATSMDKTALRLAAAVEVVQNFLLIVDDAVDRSPLRRGQPTIHELYKSEYHPESAREGDMVAIFIGMLAQHAANYIILNLPVNAEYITKSLSVMHLNISTTGIGQIDDVQQQIDRLPITTSDLLRKYQQKSSYYTFVNPLESALALAGKWNRQAHEDCGAFGLPAGVAFQLRDDYIGIFGDTSATGKANLEDIREGKYTFMMHYAAASATKKQSSTLLALLGKQDANEDDLETVRNILNETGAADKAMKDAHVFADEAKQAAKNAGSWRDDFANILEAMVTFSVERTV